MAEAQTLSTLAASTRRRHFALAAVQAVSVALVVTALVRLVTHSALAAIGIGAVIALATWRWLYLVRGTPNIDARAFARHLDARFPTLSDSSELLLRQASALGPLERLQRELTAETFRQLDSAGELAATAPGFATARAARWLLPAIAFATVLGLVSELRGDDATASAGGLLVRSATVRMAPLDYTGAKGRTVKRLDFETLEAARVHWQIELSAAAQSSALVFHNGDELPLRPAGGQTWESPEWSAFATVYRVLADGRELAGSIHRVAVTPDAAPHIEVSSPTEALELLPANPEKPLLRLSLVANDDYGVESAQARVTLARGSGEQVRFREKALPLEVTRNSSRRELSVDTTLDLIELGMERGDELFVFAEVADNRPGDANVATTSTFIVRWPGDEAAPTAPVATVAVAVLPEYFRSQRQIIIDTEKLLGAADRLETRAFEQRAQDLAFDQKLLRLRYGKFLGEEFESGIGEIGDVAADEPADGEHDDEHAGHETSSSVPAAGDVASAIAPFAHMHDTAEHATLFDPETRALLKAALEEMWEAELHLRLADPAPALPFEYRALELIKRVQQSSRVFLRRAGFRPPPVDENRRLNADLDEVEAREQTLNEEDAADSTRLRKLLAALNSPAAELPAIVNRTAPLIEELAASDTRWLEALRAIESLKADYACTSCTGELSAALWRQLDPQLATPASGSRQPTPLAAAYGEIIDAARSPR